MVQISTILTSIALASSTLAAPTRGSGKYPKATTQNASCPGMAAAVTGVTNAKAVYFITNDACNSVVALKVTADGTLSDGSITMTGGSGMNGIDGATGNPAAPDSLFSQGAVKTTGNVSA